MRRIALLRGINVGGKNMLPMKALAAMFERAGCTDVRTYIQSGNVVFDGAEEAGAKVVASILRDFGLKVPVLIRSARELRAVAEGNPLLAAGAAVESLHVVFLADRPAAKAVAALDPDRSPGDTFVVKGREVYLSCPNGVGQTKLTNAWFDSKLQTISSGRNWRTVLELVRMSGTSGT